MDFYLRLMLIHFGIILFFIVLMLVADKASQYF
jgi:hypothetical protein